jgi:hypothetical protein
MQMPSLCARCGEKPPTATHSASSQHQNFFTRMKYTINYEVPLCTDCQAKIKQRKNTGKIIMIAGMLVAIVALLPMVPYFLSMYNAGSVTTNEEAMALSTSFSSYTPFAIVAVAGVLLAIFGRWFGERSFAKWNGKLFQFNNKTFHAAFANLNPSISRKI